MAVNYFVLSLSNSESCACSVAITEWLYSPGLGTVEMVSKTKSFHVVNSEASVPGQAELSGRTLWE